MVSEESEKERKRLYKAAWYLKNRARIRQEARTNREIINAKKRAYYAENREKITALKKASLKRHPDTPRNYDREYKKAKRAKDPVFKLKQDMRTITLQAYKRGGWDKSSRTFDLIGCSPESLQSHLVLSAIKRYGFWMESEVYHIDHIIPLKMATTEEELVKLCHYTNLQLLYPQDNIQKGAKL